VCGQFDERLICWPIWLTHEREWPKIPIYMIKRQCPACNSADTVVLEALTKFSYFEYFRCRYCGTVWDTPKRDPSAPPHHVTLPPLSATVPDPK
jgi:hypothetical protein